MLKGIALLDLDDTNRLIKERTGVDQTEFCVTQSYAQCVASDIDLPDEIDIGDTLLVYVQGRQFALHVH
jgi:hypothetical protein